MEKTKVHNYYPEYKTGRQWAREGYLPKDGAKGESMWTNRYCQRVAIYFAPDEVRPATDEQVHQYFAADRQRRNAAARQRRERIKAAEKAAEEQKKREDQQNLINAAITPYLQRILELRQLIGTLTTANSDATKVSKAIVIDTETTGLNAARDEILQLSIIDLDGNVLFDSYFKPQRAREWRDAERIHGISPEMVDNAPSIEAKLPVINEIVYCADTIIGYNTYFDIDFFLWSGGIIADDAEIVDVMRDFAPIYGEWSCFWNRYKWQKLSTCAEYYGYKFKAHDSLEDAKATLYCYQQMQQEKQSEQEPENKNRFNNN